MASLEERVAQIDASRLADYENLNDRIEALKRRADEIEGRRG